MNGSREEHLQWTKQRALQELDFDGPSAALASIASDFLKHSELRQHVAVAEGTAKLASGELADNESVRQYILNLQ